MPEEGVQQQRRKLLLVYIHGFMGAETSFRSFPAHVHNLLTVLLSETHVVHTKVYPRYASRGKITIARDDFGKWIEPHQDTTTDVVLLGHSMGGLLSAEVVLAPAIRAGTGPLRHRILGTINFDVPFLGMHPGVVKSGLASIFKPAEEPRDQEIGGGSSSEPEPRPDIPSPTPSAQRVDTLWAPGKQDPNYNPSFANDVVLPVRKGWRNAWHFINKHSDDLTQATKKLVSSHLEFGGAMANYGELKSRYARVRALEESDARVRQSVVEGGVPPRARFVNYYTASTGRLKKPKSPPRKSSRSPHGSRPTSATPSLHVRRSTDSVTTSKSTEEQWEEAMESMTIGNASEAEDVRSNNDAQKAIQAGITLPDLPVKPPAQVDFGYIQDPEVKKLVQREHDRAVKAYDDAVAERERLLAGKAAPKNKQRKMEVLEPQAEADSEEEPPRGRAPVPEKPAQKPESEMTHSEREHLRLEKERQRMEREARRMRGEPSPGPAPTTTVPTVVTPPRASSPRPSTIASTVETSSTYDQSSLAPTESRTSVTSKGDSEKEQKPKKDRMFCTLPPKDSNGERDPTWVRVFMENVDEVGAHCGLFFVDERYERLVGDVSSRIEGWVNDEVGDRVAQTQSQSEKW